MTSLLVRTLRREPTERIPVWMMRQAGRYLPRYRAVRATTPFLDLCRSPDLAAEVSLEPVERFDVDAAIVFADILLTADAMGIAVEFAESGPRIEDPIRTPADVQRVHAPNDARTHAVSETVAILRKSLPPEKAVIGFSAAPFTLASYMIEGETSREHQRTRLFAIEHPKAFRDLLARCADALVPYLREQAAAGADALQLFDTWAGVVDAELFRERVLPAVDRVLAGLGRERPPTILFPGLGTEARLLDVLGLGAEAISIDARADLGRAHAAALGRAALQGNLDPVVLLTTPERVREETVRMLSRVPPGASHVANLGHGILKETPPENAAAFVDAVRSFVPAGTRT